MKRNFKVLTLALWTAVMPALAEQVTINFDDKDPGFSPGASAYATQGVMFQAPTHVSRLSDASSPPNVLRSGHMGDEFDTGTITIHFNYDQNFVSFRTGIPGESTNTNQTLEAKAFDANDRLVDRQLQTLVGGTRGMATEMSLEAPSGQAIRKIVFEVVYPVGSFEYIDDLKFSAEAGPPAPATAKPQVSILSPADGSFTATALIKVSGTISGPDLYPQYFPPRLLLHFAAAPLEPQFRESYLTPYIHGESPLLHFELPLELSYLGTNKIIVQAENLAGTGEASATVTFFPYEIASEHGKHGEASYGPFQEGRKDSDCWAAFYEKGAIFSSPAGTYSVFGDIYKKWKSLTSPVARLGMLGCATSDERTTAHHGRAQDFARGRVYSHTRGAFHVVEPFRSAIDALDFSSDFGLPVSDPVVSNEPLLPRLWQRFEVESGTVLYISAMEITADPPTLWIATPDIVRARRLRAEFGSRTPTLWRSFSCRSFQGPCDGLAPEPIAPRLPSSLAKACSPLVWPGVLSPQWLPLTPGKIESFMGFIRDSSLADIDSPYNHYCNRLWEGVDWCTKLFPLPAFEGLLLPSQETLEIEWEWCLTGYPIPIDPHDPSQGAEYNLQPGDLLFVAGRSVFDCGHAPVTEIHPPSLVINLHTEGAATVGELLYFDWWYPGEQVSLDVYPPPRPAADARLWATIPSWSNTFRFEVDPDGVSRGFDSKGGILYEILPVNSPNHIRVKFSGRADATTPSPEADMHTECFAVRRHLLKECVGPQLGVMTLGWIVPD